MIDLDDLIAEARRLEGDYSDNYEVVTHMSVLADALESVRAERDAALARIAELEAEIKTRAESFDNVLAGREASPEEWRLLGMLETAEARIAEAAKLHRPSEGIKVPRTFAGEPEHTCRACLAVWPCPTAVALGLNEGENTDD